MKITEKQLKEAVKNEIENIIHEQKYNILHNIVKECINETFGEFDDPRFQYSVINDNPIDDETGEEGIPVKYGRMDAPTQYWHSDKFGDYNGDITDIEASKEEDNDDSWYELEKANNRKKEELGNNAQDIFNGNYGVDYGDYFDDSDHAFTQDYWRDEDNDPTSWTLADIQRSKVRDVYNTVENIVRENFNKLLKNKLNETVNSGVTDTHFAILKPINKIIFSWDYSNNDPEDLKLYKRDYFMQDIIDNGFNPKEVKILTKKACIRQGINPEDESNWDNAFEYKVESINTTKETIKEDYGDTVQSDDQDYENPEPLEAIDFFDFENICHSNGWDWHNSFDVNNGQQHGVRYVFAQGKGCTFEELVSQIKQKANDPNGIIVGTATNKNAPEIKYYSIIILFV